MDNNLIASIQLAGYKNIEHLTHMIEGILLQDLEAPYEINLLDNGTVPNVDEIMAGLIGKTAVYNIIREEQNCFGIAKASGKYVAFCCDGAIWVDCYKLKKQIRFLEQSNEYIACVHDIDLVDENGLSYAYSAQQRYKQPRYCPNKIYSWKDFQKGIRPGSVSTLVSKNLFDPSLFSKSGALANIEPVIALFALITFNGLCFNFYDQQMVKKICTPESLKRAQFPALNLEQIKQKKQCAKLLQELAINNYAINFDISLWTISLARCFFNYYKTSLNKEEDLTEFIKLYDEAYKSEFNQTDQNTSQALEEKALFNALRYDVTQYQIRKGSKSELELFKYSAPAADHIRVEYILRCYRYLSSANLILAKKLYEGSYDVSYVRHHVRKRLCSAPARKLARSVIRYGKKIRKNIKRIVTYRLRKKGYSYYMANEWYNTVWADLMTNKRTSLYHKIWCYKRGFLPWRLPQYGATKENYRNFLSDRDYMYLHQLNNSYKKWIEDKMTLRYVLEPYKKYLPQYYFQIIRREGYPIILPLMDCPEGYDATFDDLLRLLQEKGKLALKAASGTHGIGFYKLAYENEKYYLNNKLSSEYEIIKTIRNFKSFYLVTEYVNMHDSLKQIYDGSVNTIRIMMINKDGHHPQLLDSYMRIGSSKSGVTDNIAFGGVTCRVDIHTGAYSGGEQLSNHTYTPCLRHPDSGALIEGTIPHWNETKETLIELCKYIGQLEYLGFDIVATPDSFCILEINSHQDLQKFPLYDAQIKKFLFDKLERKCRFHHIKRI